MARLNVEVSSAIYKRFQDQCDEDGRSVSDVTRTLVLDFVERRVREKHRLAGLDEEKKEDERGQVGNG